MIFSDSMTFSDSLIFRTSFAHLSRFTRALNRSLCRLAKSLVAFVFAASLSTSALAVPMLSFEFTNSGQTVDATADVEVQARITNLGDPIVNGLAQINFGPVPAQIFNQYIDVGFGIPFLLSLATGTSIDFTLTTYQAWPITGNLGDPVPPGVYRLPISVVGLEYKEFIFDPDFREITHPVDTSGASDFVWTVRGDAVPVSSTPPLALILLGLTILVLRWRYLRASLIAS